MEKFFNPPLETEDDARKVLNRAAGTGAFLCAVLVVMGLVSIKLGRSLGPVDSSSLFDAAFYFVLAFGTWRGNRGAAILLPAWYAFSIIIGLVTGEARFSLVAIFFLAIFVNGARAALFLRKGQPVDWWLGLKLAGGLFAAVVLLLAELAAERYYDEPFVWKGIYAVMYPDLKGEFSAPDSDYKLDFTGTKLLWREIPYDGEEDEDAEEEGRSEPAYVLRGGEEAYCVVHELETRAEPPEAELEKSLFHGRTPLSSFEVKGAVGGKFHEFEDGIQGGFRLPNKVVMMSFGVATSTSAEAGLLSGDVRLIAASFTPTP